MITKEILDRIKYLESEIAKLQETIVEKNDMPALENGMFGLIRTYTFDVEEKWFVVIKRETDYLLVFNKYGYATLGSSKNCEFNENGDMRNGEDYEYDSEIIMLCRAESFNGAKYIWESYKETGEDSRGNIVWIR